MLQDQPLTLLDFLKNQAVFRTRVFVIRGLILLSVNARPFAPSSGMAWRSLHPTYGEKNSGPGDTFRTQTAYRQEST